MVVVGLLRFYAQRSSWREDVRLRTNYKGEPTDCSYSVKCTRFELIHRRGLDKKKIIRRRVNVL